MVGSGVSGLGFRVKSLGFSYLLVVGGNEGMGNYNGQLSSDFKYLVATMGIHFSIPYPMP